MKTKYWLAIILTAAFGSSLMAAQAPSGSTGQCKDGSYTSAAKKSGACSGHKGVQSWFGATGNAPTTTNAIAPGQEPAPTGTAASKPAPARPSSVPSMPTPTQSSAAGQTPMPGTAPSQSRAAASQNAPRQQAPGGGPGMVWVNTSSKVYHCPGTEFYGTTKNGKYMSQADAISMGARADHNKPCEK